MISDRSPASGNRVYSQFYAGYTAYPPMRSWLALSDARLPHPDRFSNTSPNDVCAAAFHGLVIFPPGPQAVKDSVKDDGPYSRTIQARLSDFRDKLVPAANDALRDLARMTAFNAPGDAPGMPPVKKAVLFTVEIEDDKPFTRDDFMEFPVMSEGFIEAALQYEKDRLYKEKTLRERVDHFVADYGFPHFKRFKGFLDQLDACAHEAGHTSYVHLAVPTKYLDLMAARHDDPTLLAEVKEKRDLLAKQPCFVIRSFFDCRVFPRPFYIDVQSDGVFVRLDRGQFRGSTFVFNSAHVSDRHHVIDPGLLP